MVTNKDFMMNVRPGCFRTKGLELNTKWTFKRLCDFCQDGLGLKKHLDEID